MATVGWAGVVIGILAGGFAVLRYFFEQIAVVSQSAIKAIRALREVRQEIRAPEAIDRSSDQQPASQQRQV